MLTGIVAEYNPFHNGHLYHIDQTKRALGVPVVVALSASFTQRGLPAFCDKFARARMALAGGASLVVELPTFFSSHSGAVFAQGAVDILNALQVSHLSFGVEPGTSPDVLEKCASILAQEPPAFKQTLKRELGRGASYSKANALALGFSPAPNQSLALSYMSHIKKKRYEIIAYPIERQGAGHHASASRVRENFESGGELSPTLLPPSTQKILRECKIVSQKNLEKIFDFLKIYLPMRKFEPDSEGMGYLLLKNVKCASSFDDFVGRCVCARYTRSHIQRHILRILLGIDRWTDAALRRGGAQYVRVLGYDDAGREILHALKKNKETEKKLEIVSRLVAVKNNLGRKIAEIEFRADALWETICGEGYGRVAPMGGACGAHEGAKTKSTPE